MPSTAALIGTWFTNAAAGQRARLLTLPADTGGHSFILEYVNQPYAGQYALPLHFILPGPNPSRSLLARPATGSAARCAKPNRERLS